MISFKGRQFWECVKKISIFETKPIDDNIYKMLSHHIEKEVNSIYRKCSQSEALWEEKCLCVERRARKRKKWRHWTNLLFVFLFISIEFRCSRRTSWICRISFQYVMFSQAMHTNVDRTSTDSTSTPNAITVMTAIIMLLLLLLISRQK